MPYSWFNTKMTTVEATPPLHETQVIKGAESVAEEDDDHDADDDVSPRACATGNETPASSKVALNSSGGFITR